MFDYHSLGPYVGEQEIVMERQFNAPRTLMFQVFTQPEHLKRWWAPQPYTLPVCTIDLRPGGIWHYCMRSPEGQDQWARSVYREIVPPEKLVYTTTFADEHANPIEGMPEHLTTVIFTEEAGKTRVTAPGSIWSSMCKSCKQSKGEDHIHSNRPGSCDSDEKGRWTL
jgi:uncharacterized protein YndB with AHSA1/START domain